LALLSRAEIDDLPAATREQLFSELLDGDALKELEESGIINWNDELSSPQKLGSRLSSLWNRSAGDCLLDSVLQATWGVFDRDNALRRAMYDSLREAGHLFYPRWKDWEVRQALELDYTIDDSQLAEDWSALLNLASQPGSSLEQLHVFCLAHVLRRPIVIYGVKYVKSWRGENLGYARFEGECMKLTSIDSTFLSLHFLGVYLPLLWESSFCSRSPIALGYTRGHFCALVPPEPTHSRQLFPSNSGAIAAAATSSGASAASSTPSSSSAADVKYAYLPLVTAEEPKQV